MIRQQMYSHGTMSEHSEGYLLHSYRTSSLAWPVVKSGRCNGRQHMDYQYHCSAVHQQQLAFLQMCTHKRSWQVCSVCEKTHILSVPYHLNMFHARKLHFWVCLPVPSVCVQCTISCTSTVPPSDFRLC